MGDGKPLCLAVGAPGIVCALERGHAGRHVEACRHGKPFDSCAECKNHKEGSHMENGNLKSEIPSVAESDRALREAQLAAIGLHAHIAASRLTQGMAALLSADPEAAEADFREAIKYAEKALACTRELNETESRKV